MLHASVRHVPYMTLMQTFHMTLVAAGMQTFHMTLVYASAIAPFCARLMQHQVHSGIPPSLPTLFEGRHSCSSTPQLQLFLSGHATTGFVESKTFWHENRHSRSANSALDLGHAYRHRAT